MKILLLGEFSGLHQNLKEGLSELGHEVRIASSGDGWKKIDRDYDLSVSKNYILKKIQLRTKPLQLLKEFKGYDIVQIINPFIFPNRLFPLKYFFKKIIDSNKKTFLLAAGDDSYFWRVSRYKLDYGPFEDNLQYDKKADSYYMQNDRAFSINSYIAEKVNGIIPSTYSYYLGYEGHPNLKNIIPFPINLNKINYEKNVINQRIKIFHGLNRYGFKGTRHVEKAFEILKKRYPNDLELTIDGHLPLNEYLKVLKNSNIVIDQVNSYSWGMNALYSMGMGKIVLGGAEELAINAIGLKETPIFNIKPDANDIVSKVEYLLENKRNIEEIGHESRKFVEDVHDHVRIAQKYVNTWLNLN